MNLRPAIGVVFAVACSLAALNPLNGQDLTQWKPIPTDWKGVAFNHGQATMSAEKWSFLVAPDDVTDGSVSATITIAEPANRFNFFGGGWSAWPDPTFGDGGFEAGLLLRGGKDSGYRVQLSHKYQVVALVKHPEGGYLRVAPCEVKLNAPHQLEAAADGDQLVVRVDGAEKKIRYRDDFLPLEKGSFGVGVNSGAKVTIHDVAVKQLPSTAPATEPAPHQPQFAVRTFLGGRQFIFDGDEPILQLHYAKDPSCFAKLRPGYKPQLTFDSHWGLENQGAFPEAKSTWTEPTVTGSGKDLRVAWSARNVNDHFTTESTLKVGFDSRRGTYTYDIDSVLEVLPGEPFHFRYGFDFEHHTPLDPFRWQYLIAKRRGGELYHRPVYPIDPGPQNDLETYHGLRVWYGRHNEALRVTPAVEYAIEPEWNRDPKDAGKPLERKLNTAVCAAFYDTGVSFAQETAPPGTKIHVNYRYTGYPAAEAAELFQHSTVYDAPTLDPNHHYIFADEWPKLTFTKFEPLSRSWIYGRTPFMTGHNQRPTYELEKNCGTGSGYAMKLGAASFGKANWPMPEPLTKGRYVLTALVKSVNVLGPGGRIELEALQAKTKQKLAERGHFVSNGTFDWQPQGFVFDVPEDGAALSLAFGNAGTGEMLVTDVEFRKLGDGEALPTGVAARPNDKSAPYAAAPPGALADYRMEEGRGFSVFNYAGGPHLDLANLEWVVDEGRPALRFADNPKGQRNYRRDGPLAQNYLNHPGYVGKDVLPVALAGHHGGGGRMQGLTLAAWIKPAAEMGRSTHRGKGDVIGYGARRFILSLHGDQAPYQLAARVNVSDTITSNERLQADRWYHVALTAEPYDGQWRVRLFVDGNAVGEGVTKNFPADSVITPSLILGLEIFYFHDAYYRGLIGRTLVFNRSLPAEEIAELAAAGK